MDSFCDLRFKFKKEELVQGWDESLQAPARRNVCSQSVWLCNVGKSKGLAQSVANSTQGNPYNPSDVAQKFRASFYGSNSNMEKDRKEDDVAKKNLVDVPMDVEFYNGPSW